MIYPGVHRRTLMMDCLLLLTRNGDLFIHNMSRPDLRINFLDLAALHT